MGKTDGCLRCLFVFFNTLFVMEGFALVACTIILKIHMSQIKISDQDRDISSLISICWTISLTYLFLSSLAVYGGCAENKCALQLFSALMFIIFIGLLTIGIIIAQAGPNYYMPIVTEIIDHIKSKILPVIFGMAFIALCGMGMSIAMAKQISSYDQNMAVRTEHLILSAQNQLIPQPISYSLVTEPSYSEPLVYRV